MIKFRTVVGTKYFESIWCILRNQKGFLREVMTKLPEKRKRSVLRKETVLQLDQELAESLFLNRLQRIIAGGSFKEKGCHNRKDDIQMRASQTDTVTNKRFSSCHCGLSEDCS